MEVYVIVKMEIVIVHLIFMENSVKFLVLVLLIVLEMVNVLQQVRNFSEFSKSYFNQLKNPKKII